MITQSQQLLLNSLYEFYSDEIHSEKLLDVINHRKGVSLRNIEWFITNYAKSNQIIYKTKNGKDFPVHIKYKASLDGYSKRAFDPFCRTERIQFNLPGDIEISTTVSQLNFLRWCISNDIIHYIENNKHILKK
uniref:Uncharacterized protein n=1 Tax=viral metagenome TaxID=1070528 RepID=A0A6C0JTE7_9ZZZZ